MCQHHHRISPHHGVSHGFGGCSDAIGNGGGGGTAVITVINMWKYARG